MAGAFDLSGYEDITEIGRGAYGIVYRARQVEFGRDVAIKVLTGQVDEDTLRRFDRERLAIGSLSGHANIVTVYASGHAEDGRPYFVMEYLSGASLADRLREGPLDWREGTEIGVKVAGALTAAHAAGVLHRDVKPENIIVSGYGEPKLGDFGIARVENATRTRTGVVTATVAHAAPEIIEGQPASEASDVYSLASTIHALIAGSPAFVRDTDESLIPVFARIATEPVPDLRPRGVPDAVCTAIEAAMAKDPAARTPTAAAHGDQLQAALDGSAPASAKAAAAAAAAAVSEPKAKRAAKRAAKPKTKPAPKPAPTKSETAPKPTRAGSDRRRLLVGLLVAAVAVAGAVGLVALSGGGDDDGGGKKANGGTQAGGGDAPASAGLVISVGASPTSVSAAGNAAWVANFDDDTVSRIDTATNTVTATIDVGKSPLGIASSSPTVTTGGTAGNDVWVTNSGSDTVSRIDPTTNTVIATVDVGAGPDGVAIDVATGEVWVTNFTDDTVSRIDPATETVAATVDVGNAPTGVTIGGGAVWVANSKSNTVSRIDPTTSEVVATVDVGKGPHGVAVGIDLWVTNSDDDTVTSIDLVTNRVTATVDVGNNPTGVAAEGASVVVADSGLSLINGGTNEVVASVPAGRGPDGVDIDSGVVWVANSGDNTVTRLDESTL